MRSLPQLVATGGNVFGPISGVSAAELLRPVATSCTTGLHERSIQSCQIRLQHRHRHKIGDDTPPPLSASPVGEREFFRSARGDSDCMRPIAADDVKVTGGEENGALLGDQTGRSPNCHVKRRACEPLA